MKNLLIIFVCLLCCFQSQAQITSPAFAGAWHTPSSQMFVAATGGTVTTDGDYKIHTFTISGTFTVTTGGDVEVLIVAGGGGGSAGGGGGGGLIHRDTFAVIPNAYSIAVGAGGTGGNTILGSFTSGTNGGNSSFDCEWKISAASSSKRWKARCLR